MIKFWIIIFFAFTALPAVVHAQMRPGMDEPSDEAEADHGKKEKKVIPRVKAWRLDVNSHFVDTLKIDTLNHDFHNYHPAYRNSITNTYTGNYGGAYLSNDFSKRQYNSDFYFFQTHDAYLLTPRNIDFYNTTTPYTMLDYSQSENKNRKNETRFNVLHSQNITPHLNVTFRYDQATSAGQYNYQENKNHFITLYSAYTTDKLNVYGGFIVNRVRNQESGGMVSDSTLLLIDDTEFINMWLPDARSELKNTSVFATGEYKLGVMEAVADTQLFRPIVGFIYSFNLSNNFRKFWEGEENNNSDFFPDYYLNPYMTHDSLRFNMITNMAQIKFYESAARRYSFGKRAYIGADLVKSFYAAPGYSEAIFPFHPGKYINNVYVGPEGRWNRNNYTNIFAGGGIFRREGKFWTWNFDGRLYLSGFKAGQTELTGTISKPFPFWKDSLAYFNIEGNLQNRVPDYFQQHYFSNRIKWDNNFINEQQMNAGFRFFSPRRKLEAAFRYSLFNNYLYHDTLGIPAQTKSELLVLSAYLDKVYTLGNLNVRTRLLWQKATAPQYLRLPDLSAQLTLLYKMTISKVLFTEIGLDTRYNTEYYADAYHPATGFFYLQNEKKLGGYPYMDAFADLKLKRTRVFFQYLNIGSSFLNKPYFTALHYPMNRSTFRLGVAWSFYD